MITSGLKRCEVYKPLYEIHPRSGATIEVFYAESELAASFGMRGWGWLWWACQHGLEPDGPPADPFATS